MSETTIDNYKAFLRRRAQIGGMSGFEPKALPEFLFPFQASLVEWSLRKGKAAIFADCGLGKTPMQLAWADAIVQHTNRPVLILTPLAVGPQTIAEGRKFGIEVQKAVPVKDLSPSVYVTNYEQLHKFAPEDWSGLVCDESSILKNFDGATRDRVVEFMRTLPYRLLCTATAAPNDYVELGNSAEALGEMGFQDMVSKFFRKETGKDHLGWGRTQYKMRGHAEKDFWRWVCSWSRAVRKPSDLGFDDGNFVLPELATREHVVTARRAAHGMLFDLPAVSLPEQREERRRTIQERCEMVESLVCGHKKPAVAWVHLNEEGDLVSKLVKDSEQLSGADSDERKEELLAAFASGQLRVLVTKPVLAGFGLNWQHCSHQTFFPSHSFEQYYQSVRRSWRFGQKNRVTIDIVTSEGSAGVLANMQRKAEAADAMFARLVEHMNNSIQLTSDRTFTKKVEVPSWLAPIQK